MNLRRTLLLSALLVPLAFSAPGFGAEGPDAAAEAAAAKNAKEQISYFDRDAKKAKDLFKYADLMAELCVTKHSLVAKHLGKILVKSKDLDRQMIAADFLGKFKGPEDVRDTAGKELLEALDARGMENDVVEKIVISIGAIDYKPAVPKLCEILRKGGDPWLLVHTVRIVGDLKDKRALPILLELWERSPVGYSWETGEVTVDTGSSGTADQEAAEAAWHAQYDSVRTRGRPPIMLKAYIQEIVKSVKKITDVEMKKSSELRAWMELHAKELAALGVEVPRFKGGTRKPGDDEDEDSDEK
jgi:hypothetical protein